MDIKSLDNKIRQFVYKVRGRLREQKIINYLINTVGIGLGIGIMISVISLFVPLYYAVPAAVLIEGFSFMAGIVIGICKTPTPMQAALMADAKGYKEKLSTAFYLRGKEDSFSMLQKRDAVRITEAFQIRKEFPLQLPLKRSLLVFGLAVLFVISSLLETPARDNAVVKHEVNKEVKEEIAKLEKVEKSIKKNAEISSEEVKDVEKQLENAKKELEETQSKEELKKAKERIQKKMEMAGEKTDNKALSQTLSQAVKEAKDSEMSKQKKLAKEALEALEKAEKGSRKDKKEAYEKLKKLAQAFGDESLQKAAEEYKESDYSENDYADAKKALNDTLNNRADNNQNLANNSSNNANRNSSQNSSSGKNQKSSGSNNNSQNSSGQSNNAQTGNQQGNSGQAANNGQKSNRGSSPGWNKGSENGKEGPQKTDESITVPDGEIGDDENLTGKANGNNNSTKEKASQSKTWSGNKVSYGQVSGEYKKKAYKKIDGSNYPGKLKDKIRDYFDGLN